MYRSITFIVPKIGAGNLEHINNWVENLPELSLLGNIKVVPVEWKEEYAGSIEDWVSTVQQIVENWSDSEGFVIWAPSHALLELAGSLRLVFPKPGKPIVLFAADKPKLVYKSKSKLLGLKSSLINSTYLAQSDIAEVTVLSDGGIYRPQQCAWGKEVKSLAVVSENKPIATIDFKLNILDQHLSREKLNLTKQLPVSFSENLRIFHWFPGIKPDFVNISAQQQAVIMTNADFWGNPQVLALQESLRKQSVPTIWYSPQHWGKNIELSEKEIAISHDQPWWVALVTQFSFGNAATSAKAFELIKANCN